MAASHNTIPYRIVSLLCLLVILFVAVPYATCAPAASHSMANMPMGHCDPCCSTDIAATAPCCVLHPQPAVPAAQAEQTVGILVATNLHSQPFTTLAIVAIPAGRASISPPPPLRPNLRI